MTAAESIQAPPIDLPMIQQIAEQHLLWLQSDGKEGRRANLGGYDLSGLSLVDMYLPEANFRAAIFTGTDFSRANLQGADFSEAELEQTNFREAKLEGANFARAEARRAYFDQASAIEANFSHAVMEGASAIGADFSGVKFRDAILSRSDFTDARLIRANLRYSRAAECVFDRADLSAADCRDTIFDYTRFKDALLQDASMRGASFEQVHFTDTDFSKVSDIDSEYQSESYALEKLAIQKEIENLAQVKEEVSQYEEQISRQRRDIAQKRRILGTLNELEGEVSGTLIGHMNMFRNIAIFWFIVVALFATVLVSRIIEIGVENLNYLEIGVVSAVLVGVLGAHILSAALSFNIARKFARYVRLRREKLAQIDDSSPEEFAQAHQEDAHRREMTYL